jgi:hypothetical protein
MEAELEQLSPVAYGGWKDGTPILRARHRQVKRWRTGASVAGRKAPARLPFQLVWPIGERQRQSIDPTFSARSTRLRASQRLFLHNCSEETVRELRVRLGGEEVAYEPALEPHAVTEIHWVRNPAVRAAAFVAEPGQSLRHRLIAEFAVAKGMKRGQLVGELSMHASDGWTSFSSEDGTSKEVE